MTSPVAAWRLLVENHLLPVVESGSAKFDEYLAQLLEPSVMAQLVAWQPQMRMLFEVGGGWTGWRGQAHRSALSLPRLSLPVSLSLSLSLSLFVSLCAGLACQSISVF